MLTFIAKHLHLLHYTLAKLSKFLRLQQAFARLMYLGLRGNLHSARFTLALAETVWFITLAWPGDTFNRPTYSIMAGFAVEEVWAVIFFVTAACQWWILLWGRYHSKFAIVFSFFNMLLWVTCVFCMYASVFPPPAAISGELALTAASIWIFFRSGLHSEEREHG